MSDLGGIILGLVIGSAWVMFLHDVLPEPLFKRAMVINALASLVALAAVH
jgi:hypothetical protein